MCPIFHNKKNVRKLERMRLVTSRVRVYIWLANKTEPEKGFSFIADFSDSGVGLYLGKKLKPTANVQLSFETERGTAFKARVAWCSRYTTEQKFSGHEVLEYRAGFHFVFSSENQRQQYLKYVEELRTRTVSLAPGIAF